MKACFRDLSKKGGSIGDLKKKNKVDLTGSLKDQKNGKTFKHFKITFI